MLGYAGVKAAIQAGKTKQIQKSGITALRVLQELARLSTSDARKLFAADGTLKPASEWDDETAAAVAGVDVVESRHKNEAGEWESEYTKKVKLWDKNAALANLGRHFGLLQHTLNVPQLSDLTALLARKVIHECHPGPTKGPGQT